MVFRDPGIPITFYHKYCIVTILNVGLSGAEWGTAAMIDKGCKLRPITADICCRLQPPISEHRACAAADTVSTVREQLFTSLNTLL